MARQPKEYYQALARHYDWFVWDEMVEEQMHDLVPLLRSRQIKTVLDCACGTGVQAIPLARAKFRVTASDLSPDMLERCWQNAEAAGVRLTVVESDVRELSRRVTGPFDAVICMGNVLPHLATDDDVVLALSNMHDVLRPGGLLVIEMRYYDQLLQDRPRYIPFRVNVEEGLEHVTILYVFTYGEKTVRVSVVFLIQHQDGNVETEVESVEYNPITTDRLTGFLHNGGFTHITYSRRQQRLFCTAEKVS